MRKNSRLPPNPKGSEMAVKSGRNLNRVIRETSLSQSDDLLLQVRELLDPFAVGLWTPPVDICQTANRILVRIELPGVSPGDISLSFQGENLRIQGIKREQGRSAKLLCYYCLERRHGKFDRQIPIKGIVNPRQSRAYFHNGILTVELPKIKDRRGDVVEIQVTRK